MTAIILAGGKGARLLPYTISIPKPLLPLGDVPILEIVIRQLASAGFKRIVLTLGHMAPVFKAFFEDGKRWGVNIEYCYEEEPLGTAGSLLLVPRLEESFLVMNGDILTTLDFRELLAAHTRNQASGTIAVNKREQSIDYGVVTFTQGGDLDNYVEKPRIPYDVSMGINALSPDALELIPRGRKFDMPDLMLSLKAAGKKVHCYGTSCYWQDIGRFDDYQRASLDFVEKAEMFLKTAL